MTKFYIFHLAKKCHKNSYFKELDLFIYLFIYLFVFFIIHFIHLLLSLLFTAAPVKLGINKFQ